MEWPEVPSRLSPRIAEKSPAAGASLPKQVSGDRGLDDSLQRRPTGAEWLSSRPRLEDADGSLPLLENIWEQLDALAPPSALAQEETAPAAAKAAPAPPAVIGTLAQASAPIGAGTPEEGFHGPARRIVKPPRRAGGIAARLRCRTPRAISGCRREPAIIESPPIQWTHVLMTVFAVSGLSGIGLLAYQYYDAMQAQRQQEAAALQQRQQEEQARLAQEAGPKPRGGNRRLSRTGPQAPSPPKTGRWPPPIWSGRRPSTPTIRRWPLPAPNWPPPNGPAPRSRPGPRSTIGTRTELD